MFKEILAKIIVIIFFILIFLFPIFITVIVLNLLGFKYNSFISLLQFIIILDLIALPIEKIFIKITKYIIKNEMLNKIICYLLFIMCYTFMYNFYMNLVDYFMNSVKSTPISSFVASFLISLINLKLSIIDKD